MKYCIFSVFLLFSVAPKGFEDAVKEAATGGFDDASCELYRQVMIKTAWLAEKDLPGKT